MGIQRRGYRWRKDRLGARYGAGAERCTATLLPRSTGLAAGARETLEPSGAHRERHPAPLVTARNGRTERVESANSGRDALEHRIRVETALWVTIKFLYASHGTRQPAP